MIITIDGHAGSGKSSASRLLAAEYGFELLNTGAMYRAVALGLMRAGIDIDAEPRDRDLIAKIISHYDFQLRNNQVILNHEDITEQLYTEEVGKAASRVGTFHEVRDHLKNEQRKLSAGKDIICEGRDQGTAVFPDAPVKFFFTASVEARARRRAEQENINLEQHPEKLEELQAAILHRDQQDERRDIDPLQQATDAIVIDTTSLRLDEVLHLMKDAVERYRTSIREFPSV